MPSTIPNRSEGDINAYQWSKKYGGKDSYYSTYSIYDSLGTKGTINPSSLETYLLYKQPNYDGTTRWVKAAKLGVDGKWDPLKESDSQYYSTRAGKWEDIQSSSDNYILGDSARKDLSSGGKDSLRYQSINNAKAQLKKTGDLGDEQVNNALNEKNNIAIPGKEESGGLLGSPRGADEEDSATNTSMDTIKQYKTKAKLRNFGDSKYPENISDQQDRVIFTMYDYGVRKGTRQQNIGGNQQIVTGFGPREFGNSRGTVTLPIQSQISDSNTVDWNAETLNPIQASLATSLMDSKNIGEAVTSIEGKVKQSLKGAKGDIAQAARLYLVEEAVGAKGLLSRVTGGILNPNVELLFRGPQLRPFNFRFLLSPRNDKETKQVKRILRFFKEGMAVQETATDIFLKAPSVFQIKYEFGGKKGEDHPGLNKIKKCALTSFNVDYTPENSYMTFEDGTMTSYIISLQFQELEPITTSDYDDDTTQIGY